MVWKKKNKKIEVVSGGNDLNISPVYDHIDIERPKDKKERRMLLFQRKRKNKMDVLSSILFLHFHYFIICKICPSSISSIPINNNICCFF